MKIIFLDRDGVINNFPGFGDYIKSWQEFKFLPGVLEAIKKLTQEGFIIFVISNQAGVSKGMYSQKNLDELTGNMIKEINATGGRLKDVLYCIHEDKDNCNCRKPRIGLFQRALESVNLKLSDLNNGIYFIGDSIIDVEAGKNANLKTILVFSGREKASDEDKWKLNPDFVADNLLSAVDIVLNNNP